MLARICLFALLVCLTTAAAGTAKADRLRIATYAAPLSRDGPGLLLRDLRREGAPGRDDSAPDAALDEIAALDADILLLTGIDWDPRGHALTALADRLAERGIDYPFHAAPWPNSGVETGRDLDGDGRLGGARDAQGYGDFTGQGGLALLSRHPIRLSEADESHTAMLWRDLPESLIAADDPGADIQRLSSVAHWQVPVALPDGRTLTLLAHSATPPVFDGPDDRNGRRNHDEIRLWHMMLDAAPGPAVMAGLANLDPARGEGLKPAIRAVLGDPRLTDPHAGSANATWVQTGPLRMSYLLPAAELRVVASGTRPRRPAAGPHAPVWIDLDLPLP